MTAEEYLGQIETLDVQIQQDIEQLEELKNSALGVTAIRYDKDRVQTSPSDRLCGDVCNIVTMEQRINDEIGRFYEAKELIIRQIRGMHSADIVQILYKRYVQLKNLKQIAVEIGMGYSTVLQKHRDALVIFEDQYTLKYLF